MDLLRYVTLVCLVCILLVGYTQSKTSLTIYGKKIKHLLPEKTYRLMFSDNAENDDQLLEAVQMGEKEFKQIIGTAIDDVANSNQSIYDLVKLLGKSRINSSLLFYVFTFATQMTFKDEEVLNEHNIREQAQIYVDELQKTADELDNDNILTTLPALFAAHARLLRSEGVTSKKVVIQFAKNIIHALHKF